MRTQHIQNAISVVRPLSLRYNHSRTDPSAPVKITNACGQGWYGAPNYPGLISSISAYLGHDLRICFFGKMPNIESVVASMLVRQRASSTIYVSDEQNFCHRRFIVAKELTHIMFGSSDSRTMVSDPDRLLITLSDLINERSLIDGGDVAAATEEAAYFGAIELLLPKESEPVVLGMLNEGASFNAIAQKYKVPEKIVEFRFGRQDIRGFFESVYETHFYKTCDLRAIDIRVTQ